MLKLKNIFLILIVALLLSGCSNKNNSDSNENTNNTTSSENTQISKASTTTNNTNKNSINNTQAPESSPQNNTNTIKHTPKVEQAPPSIEKTEEELAKFSTKIYTKDSERQNNVRITCSSLNNTIVKSGETFSFTNTVGKATSQKGYQEADIFDSNGNKKKGLGGGNCQVSSTLYNAVLSLPSLKVVERHEHSNKVPYVQTGKDAAVAYGSVDFKFKNENSYDIKIYAEATKDNVSIRIVKI